MSVYIANRVQSASHKATPIIIDLGKRSAKKIRELKRGEGLFIEEVEPAIAQVKANLAKEGESKEIIPVVVIYQRKRKRNKLPLVDLLR